MEHGMMDRRFWLAMALSLLVLILSDVLFGPRRPPRRPPTAPDSSQVVAEKEVPTPPEAAEKVAPPVRDQAEEASFQNLLAPEVPTEVVVTGKDYRCTLSSKGAVIREFVLPGYTDAEEKPAQLIRDQTRGLLPLKLKASGLAYDLSNTLFQVEERTDGPYRVVRFVARNEEGVEVVRTYRFHPDSLAFHMTQEISGVPNDDGSARYEIALLPGMPLLEVRPQYDRAAMAAVSLIGKNYIKDGTGSGRLGCGGGGRKDQWKTKTHHGMVRWVGIRNKYFLGALVLGEPEEADVITERNPAKAAAGARFLGTVDLDGRVRKDFLVYLGPMRHGDLASLGAGLERAVDLGIKPIVPISKAVLWCMTTLYKVIPNYGVIILILSLGTKFLFYPLTKKSLQSMKRMQELKPEMERIKEKFKDNPQRQNQEMMKLYQKHKINPLGGCLPMLVQMPIFFALYSVLYNVIELRKAPFVLWIKDLSIPDTVAHVGGIPINPLPLIMTGTMIIQQKMTPTDPRQAAMTMMMPVIFLFFFYSLPSGLVFYWTVNNVATIVQQVWMKREEKNSSEKVSGQRREYAVASKR
jgi:YidC/Oxa1 family membrane protein insertase